MTQPRLIPLVLIAASVLLMLKGIQLIILEGRGFEPFGLAIGQADPFAGVTPDPIVTAGGAAPPAPPSGGAVTPSKVDAKVGDERPSEAKPPPGSELKTEISILEKLAERRRLLEQREKELETREDVLRATEGKIEKRIDEIKSIESKIGNAVQAKEEARSKELTDLVKMYESMKAKDAARVFDRLDTKLLVEISRQMSPRKLGDIVARMSPEAAEKLTVEIASRRGKEATPMEASRELPKIDGRGG